MATRAAGRLVRTARALADPTRVRILLVLRGRELCVCELCDVLGSTQSTLSTHLQVIRAAGLVAARKAGRWMYYALAPGARPLVAAWLRPFAAELQSDPGLRRDAARLTRRLRLRQAGSCCIGFTDPRRKARRPRKARRAAPPTQPLSTQPLI